MNSRRKFLTLFGIGAPAAVVASEVLARPAPKPIALSLNIDGRKLAQNILGGQTDPGGIHEGTTVHTTLSSKGDHLFAYLWVRDSETIRIHICKLGKFKDGRLNAPILDEAAA